MFQATKVLVKQHNCAIVGVECNNVINIKKKVDLMSECLEPSNACIIINKGAFNENKFNFHSVVSRRVYCHLVKEMTTFKNNRKLIKNST